MGTNPFFEKPFFSDSTLRTIMFASKSDIPKEVLDSFTSFQKVVDTNFESINSEIHLAKTKGRYTDESGQEQKVSTKQVDPPIQIYAPTNSIKQRLKTRGIISKKGKPLAFNPIIRESDEVIINWYASLAKGIVNYQIRWSMYHTLAKKHKMSLRKLFNKYGQEFKHKEGLRNIFPLKSNIAGLKKNFPIKDSPS